MKKYVLWASLTAALAATAVFPAFPVCAADTQPVDYAAAYAPAFAEAKSRNQEYDLQEIYNGISYAYFDITGDGIKELVFEQTTNKHAREFWVYSYDGTNLYNLGTADNDADIDSVCGYKGGILYRESYKGMVGLYYASFSGGVGTVEELMSGEYDRQGDPPTLEELSGYYDPSGVTESSGEWTELDW